MTKTELLALDARIDALLDNECVDTVRVDALHAEFKAECAKAGFHPHDIWNAAEEIRRNALAAKAVDFVSQVHNRTGRTYGVCK
jgi:hypothetical protein